MGVETHFSDVTGEKGYEDGRRNLFMGACSHIQLPDQIDIYERKSFRNKRHICRGY